jgi:hypothetical protein
VINVEGIHRLKIFSNLLKFVKNTVNINSFLFV